MNQKHLRTLYCLSFAMLVNAHNGWGQKTSAGLTLLEAPGARSAALGEAYSAATNDVTAFGYNPASLQTLNQGQIAFLHHRGATDDFYNHFIFGFPINHKGRLGLSLAHYTGGKVEIVDQGVTQGTVKAQEDLVLSMGFATAIKKVSLGLSGKYFSSELAETTKATAFAADAGLQFPIYSRLRLGAAFQNFGGTLKYVDQAEDLPRVFRTGLSYTVPGRFPLNILFDAPYFLNESEVRPALGVEINFDKLFLRSGYKSGSDLEEFSLGMGFSWGQTRLDYAFGLVEEFDSRHRVSLSYSFGRNQ